jgi:protein-tyrosine phosphatase
LDDSYSDGSSVGSTAGNVAPSTKSEVESSVRNCISEETKTRLHFNQAFKTAMINTKMTFSDGKPILLPLPGGTKLFVGSIGCVYNKQALVEHHISHIMCVCNSVRLLKYPDEFEYKRISIEDNADADIYNYFEEAISFIRNGIVGENGNVLVHCYQGKSRSVTVCAAFMIVEYNYSPCIALDIIRSVRPIAEPNPHFMAALQRLYQVKNAASKS